MKLLQIFNATVQCDQYFILKYALQLYIFNFDLIKINTVDFTLLKYLQICHKTCFELVTNVGEILCPRYKPVRNISLIHYNQNVEENSTRFTHQQYKDGMRACALFCLHDPFFLHDISLVSYAPFAVFCMPYTGMMSYSSIIKKQFSIKTCHKIAYAL